MERTNRALQTHGVAANIAFSNLAFLNNSVFMTLFQAILSADLTGLRAEIDRLQEDGEKVRAVVGCGGRTPLHVAAMSGSAAMTEMLIDAGCAIEARDHRGWTPPVFAIFGLRPDTLRILRRAGAAIPEDLALHAAILNGDRIAADRHSRYRDAFNRRDRAFLLRPHFSPENFVSDCVNRPEMLRTLLEVGANPNLNTGTLPLTTACYQKQWEAFDLLLDFGAQLMPADYDGEHPVELALRYDAPPLLDRVIERTQQPKERTRILHFAMRKACYDRNAELVRRLLAIDPGLRHHPWDDPLTIAANRGSLEIVDLLLAAGPCDIDGPASENSRSTPLMFAVRSGNRELVQRLLQAGARVNPRDDEGVSPLYFACNQESWSANYSEIVQDLLDAGADPTVRSEFGRTPLMTAVLEGGPDVVEVLLKEALKTSEPADLFAERDDNGNSIHDLARHRDDDRIFAILKEYE
ncbi:MAG: ankyrin repeat domain-containing protein [bacterium]|nr:ankyrin repeat domain-containing protein [bacterium]